ncbi:MAG: hypothetical protein A3J38_07210 [Gammaproteobacteria bacterium RIFCSPHIGHO2_12_FULL_45_9]|nr:MAG: hypothetical protein A3J38_07210 [Gammaproteobacteria bacterium RIFCSPHIGHO2_12_FULL_45_9]
MFSQPAEPSHQTLIEQMRRLGYSYHKEGLCNGLILMWAQAVACGGEGKFLERLRHICVTEDLPIKVHAVQQRHGDHLTEDEYKLLEILAFFDAVELSHRPGQYSGKIFPKVFSQAELEETAKVTMPISLQKRGGIVKVYTEPGIYRFSEWQAFFNALARQLKAASSGGLPESAELAICMDSASHSIGLRYLPDSNQWRLMDANILPDYPLIDTEQIAYYFLYSILGRECGADEYVALNVSMYAAGNDSSLPTLQASLARFRAEHPVSREIAKRVTAEGVTLAHVAAAANDKLAMENLIAVGVNLNARNMKGWSVAHIAAQNNFIDLMSLLAKHQANLNLKDEHGLSPLYVAAQEGCAQMIDVLISAGAQVNQVTDEGWTPGHVAACNGHLSVIQILASHHANFTLESKTSPSMSAIGEAFSAPQMRAEILVTMLLSMRQVNVISAGDMEKLNDRRLQLVSAFIHMVHALPAAQQQAVVADFLSQSNAFSQLLYKPRNFAGFLFTKRKYQGAKVTESVMTILNEFRELLPDKGASLVRPRQ